MIAGFFLYMYENVVVGWWNNFANKKGMLFQDLNYVKMIISVISSFLCNSITNAMFPRSDVMEFLIQALFS